jgi:hypothetical protein
MFTRRKPTEKSLSPDKRIKERKFRFSIDDPDEFLKADLPAATNAKTEEPKELPGSPGVTRSTQRGSVVLLEPVFFEDGDLELLAAPVNAPVTRKESKASLSTDVSSGTSTPAASKGKSLVVSSLLLSPS